MKLELLYFAWVREALGRDGEVIDRPPDVHTVEDLLNWLARRGGTGTAFEDLSRLRCALDQEFAPLSASLDGVREVAIFPPVTGG